MMLENRAMTAGGTASQVRNGCFSEGSSNGTPCIFPRLLVMSEEPSDTPVQTKKRMGKLKRLMSHIPMDGARAKAILSDR